MDPEILKQLLALLGQGAPADATLSLPREAAPTPVGQAFPEGSVAPSDPGASVGEQPPVALSVSPAFGAPGRGKVTGLKSLISKLRELGMARNSAAPITKALEREVSTAALMKKEVGMSKLLDTPFDPPLSGKLFEQILELPADEGLQAIAHFDDTAALQGNLAKGFGKQVGFKGAIPELSNEMITELTRNKILQRLSGTGN